MENATDRYDRMADMFYDDTGYMAPGKDLPIGIHYDEDEQKIITLLWKAWNRGFIRGIKEKSCYMI